MSISITHKGRRRRNGRTPAAKTNKSEEMERHFSFECRRLPMDINLLNLFQDYSALIMEVGGMVQVEICWPWSSFFNVIVYFYGRPFIDP